MHFKTKPWEHQVKALEVSIPYSGYYYGMDMGTGKTKVAIDCINQFDAKRILVICPKKAIPVWPYQFDLHSVNPFEYVAFTPGNKQYSEKFNTEKKAKIIYSRVKLAEAANRRVVVILNYDLFWRPPLGGVYNKFRRVKTGVLESLSWDMIIYDEAHRLMTPGGRASWGAERLLKKTKIVRLLSGTPMPNGDYSNIYAQYRAMDQEIFGTSFARFKTKYFNLGGFGGKQIVSVKPEMQEELEQKLASRMFVVRKEDVLDLPELLHVPIYCELGEAAQKIYDELDSELITEVEGDKISIANVLVKSLRLAQLAAGWLTFDDDKGTKIVDNSKIEAIEELIEDIPKDEPLVIFAKFTNEIRRIREVLTKGKRTHGEVSGFANNLADWQAGKLNTIVVQTRAGGEGIDMTRARYAVSFSKEFSPGANSQCWARIHRPGQTKKTTIYHIITKNTMDVRIESANRRKMKLIDYIMEVAKRDKAA